MTDLTQALAEISEIRAQVARGTQFRGYGPASIAVSGTLALIVAAAQAVWMKEGGRDVMPFLAVWVATAAVSVALTTFETVVRSRRVHSGFATEMIQAAVEQFPARHDRRPAVDGCAAAGCAEGFVDAAGTMGVDLQPRSVCVVSVSSAPDVCGGPVVSPLRPHVLDDRERSAHPLALGDGNSIRRGSVARCSGAAALWF